LVQENILQHKNGGMGGGREKQYPAKTKPKRAWAGSWELGNLIKENIEQGIMDEELTRIRH
jgi:hypothetical protein